MFEAADLRDWQQATFGAVQVGTVARHRLTFVPLAGATVAPKRRTVQADKKLVKDAPSIDTDGEFTATEEPAIVEPYGLHYTPGASEERHLGRR